MSRDYRMFIDNQWRDEASGKTLKSVNPATEEVIASFPDGGVTDVDLAVAAARKAFDEGPWRKAKAPERARFLHRIADGIERRADELAHLETQDSGKPIWDNINFDVPEAAACFRHFAGWASTLHGSHLETPAGSFHDYTLREPVGVVAAIAPWNFPLVNAVWKIAPAIAAGNCIVYKPATETALSTLVLAEIIQEADLPPGIVNVVTGPGSIVGDAMARHPGVDKVSFTGSTETGRAVASAASNGFKRCTLELGGKSPNVVFADCDIEKAIDGALWSIFFNAGQVCTAGARLLLQESIYEPFLTRLLEEVKKIRIGDPMDRRTRMGPLVSARHLDSVLGFIREARDAGLTPCLGGDRPAGYEKGCYIQPTVFDNVPRDARISRDEIFGPVLVVHRFRDESDAVAMANDTPYGLAAGIWTRDLARAHRMARQVVAGTVWINTYNMVFHSIPNPAIKQSGIGSELGREGLEAYTRIRNVCIDLDDQPIGYFN